MEDETTEQKIVQETAAIGASFVEQVEELIDEKFDDADDMTFSVYDFSQIMDSLHNNGVTKYQAEYFEDEVFAFWTPPDKNIKVQFFRDEYNEVRDKDGLFDLIEEIQTAFEGYVWDNFSLPLKV